MRIYITPEHFYQVISGWVEDGDFKYVNNRWEPVEEFDIKIRVERFEAIARPEKMTACGRFSPCKDNCKCVGN